MDPAQPGGPPPPRPGGQHPAYQAYHLYPGYGTPPAPAPVNRFSIASLVTGVVCCLPPLGLVLGLIALAQIRRRGQRGRGLAVAGAALSSLSTALVLMLLLTGVAGEAWNGFREGWRDASRSPRAPELRSGDCVRLPSTDPPAHGAAMPADVVGCGTPHEGEITASFPVTGFTEYPGDTPLAHEAWERCDAFHLAYVLDPWRIPRNVEPYVHRPGREEWAAGDRTVHCGLATVDGTRITGSLRGPARGLNRDQYAYVALEAKIGDVLLGQPEPEHAEAVREWAAESAAVHAEQARVLREYDWPARAAGAADRRAAEFDRAGGLWRKASRVGDERWDERWEEQWERKWEEKREKRGEAGRDGKRDDDLKALERDSDREDAFWRTSQAAEKALEVGTESAIRRALGLEAVPPADRAVPGAPATPAGPDGPAS
ncbi:DUF4190 domain-containing protein [Streptomyces sp. NPDC001889]